MMIMASSISRYTCFRPFRAPSKQKRTARSSQQQHFFFILSEDPHRTVRSPQWRVVGSESNKNSIEFCVIYHTRYSGGCVFVYVYILCLYVSRRHPRTTKLENEIKCVNVSSSFCSLSSIADPFHRATRIRACACISIDACQR